MSGKRRAADRPFPRWIPWALVTLVVVAAVVAFLLTRGAQSTQAENGALLGDKSVLTDQRDAAVGQKLDLASTIAAACATGNIPAEYAGACAKARQVQAQPIPGTPGVAGAAGRGIVTTSIVGGHLSITYTDGTTADLGQVVGSPGAAGRGITGTLVEGGRLVLTFSDGTREDAGQVVGSAGVDGKAGADGRDGADGRGVTAVGQVDGRLLVTFTDGSTEDAGPLPTGPACPDGSSQQSVTYADGRVGLGCVLDQQPAPVSSDPAPGGGDGG